MSGSDGFQAADVGIVAVLDAFRAEGFSADHRVENGGAVVCGHCGRAFRDGELEASALHRLEGASDPADLLMVVGLTCAQCGTPGSVIFGYGPNASADDVEAVQRLDLDRDPVDPVARPQPEE